MRLTYQLVVSTSKKPLGVNHRMKPKKRSTSSAKKVIGVHYASCTMNVVVGTYISQEHTMNLVVYYSTLIIEADT